MGIRKCNLEIFKKGSPIAALDTATAEICEEWVKSVARNANARVDWHYSGGIAQVLYLGNHAVRERVDKAIDELANSLDGRILHRYNIGDSGLYRDGVTQLPKNAIAVFLDPISYEQATINRTNDKK